MRALALLLLVACGPRPMFDPPEDAGGSDVKPDSQSPCDAPTMLYPDIDGDGFGDKLGSAVMGCVGAKGFAGNNLDCGDGDARMRPDQTMAQLGPATGKTSGSPFDFNCDGKEEPRNVVQGKCQFNMANMCIYTAGFMTAVDVTTCSQQYPWANRCGAGMTTACEAKYEEMRFPDCL